MTKWQQIISNSDANFEIEELKEKCSKKFRRFQKENTNNTFDLNALKVLYSKNLQNLLKLNNSGVKF